LDAAPGGTNDVLAHALGILNPQPLEPKPDEAQCKIVVFTPPSDLLAVSKASFDAGAGHIGNYAECSFYTRGEGSFRGQAGSSPAIGQPGRLEHVEELRLEIEAPKARVREVVKAIRKAHSYETPAIDVYPTEHLYGALGTGRIGTLGKAMSLSTLIAHVKSVLRVPHVLSVGSGRRRIRKAACCAGSCGRIISSAIAQRADVYVTGELRHHDAVEAAEKGLAVICVGHSNSERLALRSVAQRVRQQLPGLTVTLSLNDRDPFDIL
jgi:dinuclear metal center YbgI/SA1388 family protein